MIFELQWIPQTTKNSARVDVYGAHSNGKYLIGTVEGNNLALENFWDHYQQARKRFADLKISAFEPEGLHAKRIAITLDQGILQKAGVFEDTQPNFNHLKEFGFDMIADYIKNPNYAPHIASEFRHS
jgi:hypothetical protein